jgi:ribosome-binding factor A
MVAKQIQRELSDMLLTDKVLQYAILPEVSLGADRYLSSLTTISDVEVSGDLQVFPYDYAVHLCVCFSGYSCV